MRTLKEFCIKIFSKTCQEKELNSARRIMFTTGLKTIPPTLNSYYQDGRRSVLVGAFMWARCLVAKPTIPEYSSWGWEWNPRLMKWVPYWTDLPDVSKGCAMLVQCGCKVACRGNCKCHRMGKRCSLLCKCEGMCMNNEQDE